MGVVTVTVTRRPEMAAWIARKLAWQARRPDRVLICSELADYPMAPIRAALPGVRVDFLHDPERRPLGGLRNFAMAHALDAADDGVIACTIDDDDAYGPHWLESIVDTWRRHPDALYVGRSCFSWRQVSAPPTTMPATDEDPGGGPTCGCPGATLSFPARAWRRHPELLRYPDRMRVGEDVILQDRIEMCGGGGVAAYAGRFVILRFAQGHGHTSPDPAAGAGPRVVFREVCRTTPQELDHEPLIEILDCPDGRGWAPRIRALYAASHSPWVMLGGTIPDPIPGPLAEILHGDAGVVESGAGVFVRRIYVEVCGGGPRRHRVVEDHADRADALAEIVDRARARGVYRRIT